MFKNKISVVVPTYNREELLKETLRSLSSQSIPKSEYEVIVVDDGSTDETNELVREYESKMDVTYIFQEDLGFRVSMARNKGIKAAKYEVILLLDSGIVAPGTLLESHLEKYETSNCDSLIGFSYAFNEFEVKDANRIKKLYFSNDINTSFEIVSQNPDWLDCRYSYLKDKYLLFQQSKCKFMLYWTCHISVKRSVALAVGLFDEHFNKWGGEDVEFGLRVEKSGYSIDLIFDPLVLHLPHEKEKDEVVQSSKDNIKYIKTKHGDMDLSVLDQGWRTL